MLRVITLSHWGPRCRQETSVARDGMTGREVARLYGGKFPAPVVAADGRMLWGRALDEELHDTVVLVGPAPAGFLAGLPFLVQVFAGFSISLTLAGVYRAIFPPPSTPTVERGDDRSPTYSWAGIGTTYGAGFRVPIVYGRHRLGGQVISTQVSPLPGNPNSEVLKTLMVLGEGPFHSIGGVRFDQDDMGVLPNAFGWDPYLGAFPAGVQVNGNLLESDSAILSIRLGSTYQSPIRNFDDARNSVTVQGQLDDQLSEQVSVVPTPSANRIGVRLQFPGGLYKQTGGGSVSTHRVEFDLQWRSHAQEAWSAARRITVSPAAPRKTEFSVWFWQAVAAPVGLSTHDGFDVRVSRVTPAGATAAPSAELWVDNCVLLSVDYVVDQFFAYPRRALLAVQLRANEKLQGGQPQYSVPVEGRRIRVWDTAVGWSSGRYWDLPAVGDEDGDPFVGIWTHEPGRNPAWICADLLTSDIGLGAAFTLGDLDAEAFRHWADFCDEVSADGDAQLTCDVVLDQGEDAWDVALRIARAGRAALVISGRQIKPVYEYRDAHGRGTVTVPARRRTSIVATSNVDDFELVYASTRRRPNVIDGQFLNADLEYEQDALPVEDPEAETNDPTLAVPDEVRRETQEFYGVTNPKQVRRELLFQHALNRLVRRTVRFRCGIDQLPVEVGDIIGVQHDAMRPWGLRETYFSCRTARASSGVREIVLDRDLVITTGSRSILVQILTSAGSAFPWGGWVLDVGNGTYPAGTVLATMASQDPVDCEAGIVAVVGEFEGDPGAPIDADARGVQDFRVITATLGDDLRREFQAIEWTPDAFTLPAVEVGSPVAASSDLGPTETIEQVESVQLEREASPGRFRFSWTMPEGHRGKRARVFARRSESDPREILGEVVGDQLVTTLDPDASLLVAVCPEDDDGKFMAPDLADEVELTPPEFRVTDLDAVELLTAADHPAGILLRWAPVRSTECIAIEIRRGSEWEGSPIVWEGRGTEALVPDLPAGSHEFLARARFAGGLYSRHVTSVIAEHLLPDHETQIAVASPAAASGTHANTDTSDGVSIADAAWHATWTMTDVIDVGVPAVVRWRIVLETTEELPGEAGAAWSFPGASVEALWRTGCGRAPSRRRPGCVEWNRAGDDLDTAGALLVDPGSGPAGSLGENTRALLEVNFDGAGWEPYAPQWREAQTLSVRVRLDRVSLDYQRRVTALRIQAIA